MKKKISYILLTLAILSLTACGNDDVKVIDNTQKEIETVTAGTGEAKDEETFADINSFSFSGTDIVIGEEVQPVAEKLGEPVNYFEAPSCAAQGISKTYTYDGFEINTTPSGDKDLIAAIIVLSDTVNIPGDITIGSKAEAVKAAYGDNYNESNGSITYEGGDVQLTFLVKDDVVTSIQYISKSLN